MQSVSRGSRTIRCGVSGPTGSGKSTFAGMLASWPGVTLIREQVPNLRHLRLEEFPNSWELQKQIIESRLFQSIAASASPILVFDRTITEDREVFLELHYRLGFLNDSEFQSLRQFSQNVENKIGNPHVFIVLFADAATLRERMLSDQQHSRPRWLLDSLDLQVELYTQWRNSLKSPHIQIDTSHLALSELSDLAQQIWTTLSRSLKQGEDVWGNFRMIYP
jgi:deoxyadenosine/deoxycytidine kinase